MFKRVINHKGFWKSILFMAPFYCLLFFLIKWLSWSFSMKFFSSIKNPVQYVLILLVAGFVTAFATSYGKYWGKLKEEEHRK